MPLLPLMYGCFSSILVVSVITHLHLCTTSLLLHSTVWQRKGSHLVAHTPRLDPLRHLEVAHSQVQSASLNLQSWYRGLPPQLVDTLVAYINMPTCSRALRSSSASPFKEISCSRKSITWDHHQVKPSFLLQLLVLSSIQLTPGRSPFDIGWMQSRTSGPAKTIVNIQSPPKIHLHNDYKKEKKGR